MASNSVPNTFDIFTTCLEHNGPMLVIWGQTDRETSMRIEAMLQQYTEHFEASFPPHVSRLSIGSLVCAKYKDGAYYRAQVLNIPQWMMDKVELKFIDYGNVDFIEIEHIRTFDNLPASFTSINPQAVDFVLGNVIAKNGNWTEDLLSHVQRDLCYMELPCTVLGAVNNFRFVKILYQGEDLAEYLLARDIVTAIPLFQQQQLMAALPSPGINPARLRSAPTESSVPDLYTYKSMTLEPNSEHMVYVSYVEDGPFLFSVQLQSQESVLEKLMSELSECLLQPLTQAPNIGDPCLARCLEDNSICRGVILNFVEDKCKVFYVDFGNTDVLPFTQIFNIPLKYRLPKTLAMRFTLAGVARINMTNERKCSFKNFVTNRLLKLKNIPTDKSPYIRYCELYDGQTNIVDLLYEPEGVYETINVSKSMKKLVVVTMIEGCKRFFVQLKEYNISLTSVMMALSAAAETASLLKMEDLKVGNPCVALYPVDEKWYRSRIVAMCPTGAQVRYVDYGNEEIVPFHCLKQIEQSLIKVLPEQAIECCLYGYQNMSFNSNIESVFESLTLEREFTMKVVTKQPDGVLLVDLFDESGNNVAALLITQLAAKSPGISPMVTNKLALSILKPAEPVNSSDSEASFSKPKSPKSDKENQWRQPSDQTNRQPRQPISRTDSWRSPPTRKSWRENNEDTPSSDWKQTTNWSPESTSSKDTSKSFTRNNRGARNFNDSSPRRDRSGFRKPAEGNPPRQERRSEQRKPFERHSSRDNSNRYNGSGSEKSWSANSTGSRSGKSMNNKKRYTKPSRDFVETKVASPTWDLAPLDRKYSQLKIEPGLTETVSISWFYDPENFFCQIHSTQQAFCDMMHDLQSCRHRSPVSGFVPTGSSVVAEFEEDLILYRAMIMDAKLPYYKVQYVDFGNTAMVREEKIWQIDEKFCKLPVQAIRCGISSIQPATGQWPTSNELDSIFNKDYFTGVFETFAQDKYLIQLYDDNLSVKQQLVDSGHAIDSNSALQSASTGSGDEPVDFYMLIAQVLKVKITYIKSLGLFYAHLQIKKSEDILNHINAHMSALNTQSLQNLTPEMLTNGGVCIVNANDFWYRGTIIDCDDIDNIRVQLSDTGDERLYKPDQLFTLPAELCEFWYQANACSLSYIDPNVSVEISFKNQWQGKQVLMYVDNVEEDKLMVTLYDENGEQLEFNKAPDSAFPTVDKLLLLPIFTPTLKVVVSYVQNANSVYLQRESDMDTLTELLASLYEYYEEHGEIFTPGSTELCCAKSIDGNWYRARPISVEDDKVTVLYVDYGDTAVVERNLVKVLEKQFYELHELAVQVSLNLKELSPDLTEKLRELVEEKVFTANLVYGVDSWNAVLVNDEMNVNEKLNELNLAAPLGADDLEESVNVVEETVTVKEESDEKKVIVEDNRAQITITHIDSPSEFYVQLVANEDSINAMQSNLQARVDTLPMLEGADVGVLCAARYTVDEQWYRAEVLDADADITTVRFVDYGNTDVINNESGDLKTLPPDLLAIDKYARQCSLNIKPARDEEWSQEACEIFETIMSAQVIYADIVYQDEKNKTYVELQVDGENITKRLLDVNLAVPIVRDYEEHLANNTGFISHLNSPAEFWIQLESSVPDLEMIADRLADASTFPDLQDLSPGILCAANFPDDEMWYRARILSITVAGIEVLFIDYGNSSTALSLKVLPEDLVQMPALAQKCALNKPPHVTQWPPEITNKFLELSADGVTIFTVRKLTAGETSIVELFIDGNNVAEILLESCQNATKPLERTQPVGALKHVDVQVTHIDSPSLFWLQKTSDSEKVDEINECLTSACSFKGLSSWNENTVCTALLEDNGLWYRAKILESGEQFKVLLIDYGNDIVTSEIRAIPPSLEAIPSLAIKCQLQKPPNLLEWNPNTCLKFKELLSSGDYELQAEFLDNSDPSTVILLQNGVNITQTLFELSQEAETVDNTEELCSELTTKINLEDTKTHEYHYEIEETTQENVITNENEMSGENITLENDTEEEKFHENMTGVENIDIPESDPERQNEQQNLIEEDQFIGLESVAEEKTDKIKGETELNEAKTKNRTEEPSDKVSKVQFVGSKSVETKEKDDIFVEYIDNLAQEVCELKLKESEFSEVEAKDEENTSQQEKMNASSSEEEQIVDLKSTVKQEQNEFVATDDFKEKILEFSEQFQPSHVENIQENAALNAQVDIPECTNERQDEKQDDVIDDTQFVGSKSVKTEDDFSEENTENFTPEVLEKIVDSEPEQKEFLTTDDLEEETVQFTEEQFLSSQVEDENNEKTAENAQEDIPEITNERQDEKQDDVINDIQFVGAKSVKTEDDFSVEDTENFALEVLELTKNFELSEISSKGEEKNSEKVQEINLSSNDQVKIVDSEPEQKEFVTTGDLEEETVQFTEEQFLSSQVEDENNEKTAENAQGDIPESTNERQDEKQDNVIDDTQFVGSKSAKTEDEFSEEDTEYFTPEVLELTNNFELSEISSKDEKNNSEKVQEINLPSSDQLKILDSEPEQKEFVTTGDLEEETVQVTEEQFLSSQVEDENNEKPAENAQENIPESTNERHDEKQDDVIDDTQFVGAKSIKTEDDFSVEDTQNFAPEVIELTKNFELSEISSKDEEKNSEKVQEINLPINDQIKIVDSELEQKEFVTTGDLEEETVQFTEEQFLSSQVEDENNEKTAENTQVEEKLNNSTSEVQILGLESEVYQSKEKEIQSCELETEDEKNISKCETHSENQVEMTDKTKIKINLLTESKSSVSQVCLNGEKIKNINNELEVTSNNSSSTTNIELNIKEIPSISQSSVEKLQDPETQLIHENLEVKEDVQTGLDSKNVTLNDTKELTKGTTVQHSEDNETSSSNNTNITECSSENVSTTCELTIPESVMKPGDKIINENTETTESTETSVQPKTLENTVPTSLETNDSN